MASPQEAAGHPTERWPLVGRSAELMHLSGMLADPPAVAVIEGEAGIGKTRLVAELGAHLAIGDRRFAVGRCQPIREPFPLGPVLEVVRDLGEPRGHARLSPVAGALRPLVPELASLLPPPPEPLSDQVAARHRVFRALTELLAAAGPLVLVLEDAHWADEHTRDFVGYLGGRLPANVSLLATLRDEDPDPRLRTLAKVAPTPVNRAYVELTALPIPQVGELAAAMLGLDRIPDQLARYLWERTSGLPFAVEELVSLLRERGTLTPCGDASTSTTLPASWEAVGVPSGIRNQVLERFARLSSNARAVAETAAVLQSPVSMPVLVDATPTDEAAALRGLEETLGTGLLRDQGELLGYRHLLAAQVIYDATPAPRRRRLHAGAVSALRSSGAPSLGQLAHHLRCAGKMDEWVAAAERAADQATTLGHDHEAARLLEELLRHAPLHADRRGRLAIKLARAAMAALQVGPDLEELLAGSIDQCRAPELRSELQFLLAQLLEHTGAGFPRRRELFAQAVNGLALAKDYFSCC